MNKIITVIVGLTITSAVSAQTLVYSYSNRTVTSHFFDQKCKLSGSEFINMKHGVATFKLKDNKQLKFCWKDHADGVLVKQEDGSMFYVDKRVLGTTI